MNEFSEMVSNLQTPRKIQNLAIPLYVISFWHKSEWLIHSRWADEQFGDRVESKIFPVKKLSGSYDDFRIYFYTEDDFAWYNLVWGEGESRWIHTYRI